MKAIVHIGIVLITALLCSSPMLHAQDNTSLDKTLRFFMQKATEDAHYEQALQFPYAEDELDFWKDQRNFERALKKQSYTAYHVYVNGKWEAYLKHSTLHDRHCKHSEHYYFQASFYAQNSNKDLVAQAIEEENETGQSSSLTAVKKEH